ncbi:type II CAAX prenyl endopeptidase Rce1 family protein [Clavibacter sp. Sh2088]|uniref:CPBP family intramembrane glutamic endopeptidase n=1 Tax=Clavibacter sp. Sh2088 TaxID=3397676 RepID=UPI0039DF45F6
MNDAISRRRTTLLAGAVIGSFVVGLSAWILPDPARFVESMGQASAVPALGWVIAILVAIVYTAYTLWAVPTVRSIAIERSWFRLLAIPLALLSGVLEEMFFRRVVMDALASEGAPLLLQIVLSAALFAVVHCVWVVFARSWRIAPPVLCSTFALGVLLSLVYVASNRVIIPAILTHIAINLVIEPGLLHSAAQRAVRLTGAGEDQESVCDNPPSVDQ